MESIKKIFILSIVLLISVIFISCAKNKEVVESIETMENFEEKVTEETFVLDKNIDDKSVTAESVKEITKENKNKKGKYMLIRLKTNPSTGFDFVWDIKEGSETYVNLEDIVSEKVEKKGIYGAPTYRTYVFNAENCKEGKVTLDFDYMRNWPGGENAYHIYYDIKVNRDYTISFIEKRVKKEMIDVDIKDYDDPTFLDRYNVKKEEYEEEPED